MKKLKKDISELKEEIGRSSKKQRLYVSSDEDTVVVEQGTTISSEDVTDTLNKSLDMDVRYKIRYSMHMCFIFSCLVVLQIFIHYQIIQGYTN